MQSIANKAPCAWYSFSEEINQRKKQVAIEDITYFARRR